MALDRRKESTYFDDVHSLFVCLLQRERADHLLGPGGAHRGAAQGWPSASLSRASRRAMRESPASPFLTHCLKPWIGSRALGLWALGL